MGGGEDTAVDALPVQASDIERGVEGKDPVEDTRQDGLEDQVVDGEEQEEEEEEQDAEPASIFPPVAPEGVKPCMITMKNMDQYELKTGPGIKDTVPYKWFNKEQILDEIREVGFYCDFKDFKDDIAAYPDDEFLVLADTDEVYGQNWMFCATPAAAQELLGLVNAELEREAAEKRRLEEEEAARLAAEEAERNVVYEDKPLLPRPCDVDEKIVEEISWLDVKPTRKLMELSVSRKRADFGAPLKLSDRDAEQSGLFEFRQHKDPNFELRRRQLDAGLQACPSWTREWIPFSAWARGSGGPENQAAEADFLFDPVAATASTGGKRNLGSVFDFCADAVSEEDIMALREIPQVASVETQTTFQRLLNSSTQSEYLRLAEEERAELAEDMAIVRFLEDVMPAMEFALQQNETLDVFANEFLALRSEEVSGLGNKEDNYLRELRTFTDLVYSNGKVLSAVNWHPRMPNVVACSCVEPQLFDQRVSSSGMERNSFILIWNFADLIHPQLVLQSPHDCTHFSFNPDQPHLIAGGCTTGQVVLWDISKALAQLRRKGAAKSREEDEQAGEEPEAKIAEEGAMEEAKEETTGTGAFTIDPIEPKVISLIDQSHKRPISHLEWIPANMHVTSHGKVKSKGQSMAGTGSALDRSCHQLVTCAGDGRMMFWDTNFDRAGKRAKAKAAGDEDADEDGAATPAVDEVQWTPLFKCSLTHSEGTQSFALSKVALRGRIDQMLDMLLGQDSSNVSLIRGTDKRALGGTVLTGTGFSCTTEDGHLIFGDWQGAQKAPLDSARSDDEDSDSEEKRQRRGDDPLQGLATDEKVHWVATDHFRNSVVLARSPFFPFLLLSVSPNGFNIWKEDLNRPVFSSPIAMGMAHLTCASWSPTRPAVIIVGKSDGTVDIWDLTDQSHRPITTVPIGAYAITSLQFRSDPKTNLVASQRRASRLAAKKLPSLNGSRECERAIREVLVTQAAAQASQGDKPQLLALGDATGNLHVLEVPRNLRWRIPNEDGLMMRFFERELERVAYVAKRMQIRNEEREGLDFGLGGGIRSLAQQNADDGEPDRDSKEYKKLVEAEEKRYQALSAKLLSKDLAP